MFPIGTDRPLRRTPWVNILLIVTNVMIFFLSHGSGARGGASSSTLLPEWTGWMLFGAPTTYPAQGGGSVTFNPHLYQFLTYQFLHADIWHLLGNMLFLYVFGNNLNEKIGNAAYLTFYLTGGVLAGCGQVLTTGAPTLGASGSISAVAGLFFVLLPRANIRVFLWIFFYMDILEIPGMWFVLFSVAKDLVEGLLPHSPVAHWAHLTGNVSGVAIGFLLLYAGLVQRDHYDLLALIDRWRRRRQYEKLVSQGYNPYLTPTPPGPDAGPIYQPGAPIAPGAGQVPPPVDAANTKLRDEIVEFVRTHQTAPAAAKYLELKQRDPTQVLPAREQLDIANQLMADGQYLPASVAYEDYLRAYPKAPQNEQVELILGVIYGRYLPETPQRLGRAKDLMRAALPHLHEAAQRALAEAELNRLDPKFVAQPDTRTPGS
jgi:membrane associated rhomboid family serine protease